MTTEANLALRPGTWDRIIADAVFGGEYGPLDLRGRTVVDVGAHVGAFAVYAAVQGAARVLAFEPEDGNFRLLEINAASHPAIEAHRAAVWRSDRDDATLDWRPSVDPENTGGGTVIRCEAVAGKAHVDAARREVPAIALDAIVERAGRVGLLKIDAEGSEYPILATSRRLDRVDAIVGEVHAVLSVAPSMRVPGLDAWTGDALFDLLEDRGYEVAAREVGAVAVFRAFRR